MILLLLPLLGIWVWMIVDCATKETGNDRIAWLLVVLLAGFIGALIYLIVRRPRRPNLSRP